jgi:hypothetical protein
MTLSSALAAVFWSMVAFCWSLVAGAVTARYSMFDTGYSKKNDRGF